VPLLARAGRLVPGGGRTIYAPTYAPPFRRPSAEEVRSRPMSTGFLRFIGVLLILGSVGFTTVKSAFTGGFRYFTPGYGQVTNVPAADRR